ncbi:MAG: hypothetical protein K2J33_04060 [Alistipes sp.]|nr:hypothetical protein [Alistipes sp.]
MQRNLLARFHPLFCAETEQIPCRKYLLPRFFVPPAVRRPLGEAPFSAGEMPQLFSAFSIFYAFRLPAHRRPITACRTPHGLRCLCILLKITKIFGYSENCPYIAEREKALFIF